MISWAHAAKAMERFIDIRYELGAQGPDKYDCVSVIYHLGQEMGVQLPEKIGRWSKTNYVAMYEKNPMKSQKILFDYFTHIGVVKDFSFVARYDLVLAFAEGWDFNFYIYLGNGNFWTFMPNADAIVVGRDVICFEKYQNIEARQWIEVK